jgi:hypothetical protein
MRPLVFLLLFACDRQKDDVGDEPGWEYPSFSGDGLPSSEDTEHGRGEPDSEADTGDTGDTGGSGSTPELYITDGLFAWYDYGEYGVFGVLSLLTEASTCGAIYGGASTADGVYAYLYGDATQLSEGWAGAWSSCGDAPCADIYSLLAGEFGYVDGEITITAYDAHYVTLDWSTEASEGADLTVYNCGDGAYWY